MSYTWDVVTWYGDFENVSHVSEGRTNTIWQYEDRPRVEAVVEELLGEVDNLEDLVLEILTGRSPRTAIGVQLDTLGKIVGEERGEKTDPEYRLFILGRILVNRSNGTLPELYDILETLGVTEPVSVRMYRQTDLRVSVSGTTYGASVGDLVHDWCAGGVYLLFVYSDVAAAESFQFSSQLDTDETDTATGWSNLAGTAGGLESGDVVR